MSVMWTDRSGGSVAAMRFAPALASVSVLLCAPALGGCPSVAPPPSRLPDAESALGRMRATYDCANAIKATSAKLIYFGDRGRLRADMSLEAARPASLRMDVYAPPPLNSALETLTSDGQHFALRDLREKRFYTGPASACNIARLTNVPIPGFVLGDLLRGQAPVLKHELGTATIGWSSHGYYVVSIPSTRSASEEIHLAPRQDDWNRPWNAQRMRVLDVVVSQEGFVLYHAELDEHAPPPMDKEIPGAFPGDASIPLSGPECTAEVPRKIHVEVPLRSEDVQFRYSDVYWNPPLPERQFIQPAEPGFQIVPVACDDQAR